MHRDPATASNLLGPLSGKEWGSTFASLVIDLDAPVETLFSNLQESSIQKRFGALSVKQLLAKKGVRKLF